MTVQVSARVTPCLRIRVTGRENGIASGVTPVADPRAGVMTDDGFGGQPLLPAYAYTYAGKCGKGSDPSSVITLLAMPRTPGTGFPVAKGTDLATGTGRTPATASGHRRRQTRRPWTACPASLR